MLAKLTCRGRTFENAVAEGPAGGRRVPDPRRLDQHPVPAGGARRPRLPRPAGSPRPSSRSTRSCSRPAASGDRGTKLLTYLADVTVNQPHGDGAGDRRPGHQAARPSTSTCPRPTAPASCCSSSAPRRSRAGCASRHDVAVTDTTFRDAHQSLLATRVRTRDLLAVAGHVARMTPQLLVARGLGRRDVRRGAALPLRGPVGAARRAAPGGAQHLPADAAARPQHGRLHAVPDRGHRRLRRRRPPPTGIDVFRIFDALNDVEQMRPAIEAVRETGTTVAEVALCYTGDLSSPDEKLYTLDYYLRLAERIVDAGAHVLAIKDMAGLLRAPAARTLVTALRERFDLPVHLHTHDTPGGQLATLLAAIDAGVDAVDAASASMAGTTSQPALSALVAATDHTERETGLVARGGLRPRAVLGGDPPGLRAVRVRAARADRPRLPPRDPRRPALQPAPAGDRARARREVRADRGHVRRRQRHPRQHRQGDAVVEGGRRPRAAPGRRSAPTRPSSRRTRRSSTSPTR